MSFHRSKTKLVGTLGDLIRERRHLRLTCWPCNRHVKIDLRKMIETYGGMPLQRFVERSRCSRCGAREPSVSAPPDYGEATCFRYPDYSQQFPRKQADDGS